LRILYFGVHAILEHDEIGLFTAMGHEVFSLGSYHGYTPERHGPAHDFRPPLALRTPAELMRLFAATGCALSPRSVTEHVITAGFVDAFDVIVVMHDAHFITRNWAVLSRRPVIWRTIGQCIYEFDPLLKPLRRAGLRIVRYSPMERRTRGYIGADAVIRFHAAPAPSPPWHGSEACVFNTTNGFASRYPREYAVFRAALDGLPYRLGGAGNEALANSTGFLSAPALMAALAASRAYFYCSGLHLPYTLSFIEAWSAGIPLVVYDNRALSDYYGRRFNETGRLIRHGRDGYRASSPGQARRILRQLLEDPARAAAIGAAGRARAADVFSRARAQAQWAQMLELAVRSHVAGDRRASLAAIGGAGDNTPAQAGAVAP